MEHFVRSVVLISQTDPVVEISLEESKSKEKGERTKHHKYRAPGLAKSSTVCRSEPVMAQLRAVPLDQWKADREKDDFDEIAQSKNPLELMPKKPITPNWPFPLTKTTLFEGGCTGESGDRDGANCD